jgi:hypothetical protein
MQYIWNYICIQSQTKFHIWRTGLLRPSCELHLSIYPEHANKLCHESLMILFLERSSISPECVQQVTIVSCTFPYLVVCFHNKDCMILVLKANFVLIFGISAWSFYLIFSFFLYVDPQVCSSKGPIEGLSIQNFKEVNKI